jgi:hypothetical protein
MKLSALLVLFLSSLTLSSAYAVTDPSAERNTYSPSSEPAFDLRLDPSGETYGGRPIRVVIPDVGVYPGWLHDDIVDGTVKGIAGKSPSANSSEPDYLPLIN